VPICGVEINSSRRRKYSAYKTSFTPLHYKITLLYKEHQMKKGQLNVNKSANQ